MPNSVVMTKPSVVSVLLVPCSLRATNPNGLTRMMHVPGAVRLTTCGIGIGSVLNMLTCALRWPRMFCPCWTPSLRHFHCVGGRFTPLLGLIGFALCSVCLRSFLCPCVDFLRARGIMSSPTGLASTLPNHGIAWPPGLLCLPLHVIGFGLLVV